MGNHHHTSSPSGFDAFVRRSSSGTSSYKRRSRSGYISRVIDKLRRMLHRFISYVKRHPFKALMPIVMALISGGALTAIARNFGFRVPEGLGKGGRGAYDAYYGSQNIGRGQGGWGDLMGGMGGGSGLLQGAIKMASSFM